mmetsp:Transcript_35595/g.100053  ORF Transcript_35595/g.100053 Transcript_35595/m.100053 type:complete len:214 (-) Transcript_35595:203-844(-)
MAQGTGAMRMRKTESAPPLSTPAAAARASGQACISFFSRSRMPHQPRADLPAPKDAHAPRDFPANASRKPRRKPKRHPSPSSKARCPGSETTIDAACSGTSTAGGVACTSSAKLLPLPAKKLVNDEHRMPAPGRQCDGKLPEVSCGRVGALGAGCAAGSPGAAHACAWRPPPRLVLPAGTCKNEAASAETRAAPMLCAFEQPSMRKSLKEWLW